MPLLVRLRHIVLGHEVSVRHGCPATRRQVYRSPGNPQTRAPIVHGEAVIKSAASDEMAQFGVGAREFLLRLRHLVSGRPFRFDGAGGGKVS